MRWAGVLLLLLGAACTSSPPTVTVAPRVPADATFFAELDSLVFRVDQDDTTVALARFAAGVDVLTLPPVPFGAGYVYTLEGWRGPDLVARGRTCPIAVAAGELPGAVPLYFSRVGAWAPAGAAPAETPAPQLLASDDAVLLLDRGGLARFDPGAGAFVAGAALPPSCPAAGARGAALRSGDALFVGGLRADGAPAQVACAYRHALDAVVEVRTPADSLRLDRVGHTLTALGGGRVLLVGNHLGDGTVTRDADAAWLYDDVAGTWTRLASLATPRTDHAAAATSSTDAGPLVMVIGGRAADGTVLDDIEIYNPVRGQFTAFPARLAAARVVPTATYVPGQEEVVVAGGVGVDGVPLDTVEVVVPYSVLPAAETMSPVGTPAAETGREGHSATLLAGGLVLLAGGRDAGGQPRAGALVFDPAPAALRFTAAGSLAAGRADHGAVRLCDGTVLVVGGTTAAGPAATAELYSPP